MYMVTCPNCGEQYENPGKFCSKCGAQLNEIDDNEEYEDLDNDEYEDRNKKKNKIKIAVGIFIVIFIVIASAVGIIKYKEYTELNKRNIQVVNVNVTDYPNVKIHVEGVSDTGMSPGSYVGGIGPGSTITSCNGATYTIRIAK